ncbi:Poly(ADP-ribose) glycohydrolase, partial [Orchesella cincta]
NFGFQIMDNTNYGRQLVDPKIGGIPVQPQSYNPLGGGRPHFSNATPLHAGHVSPPSPGFCNPNLNFHMNTAGYAAQNFQTNAPGYPIQNVHTNTPGYPTQNFHTNTPDYSAKYHANVPGHSVQNLHVPPIHSNGDNQGQKNKISPRVVHISAALHNLLQSYPNEYSAVFFHQLNTNQQGGVSQHDVKWHHPVFVSTPFCSKNILLQGPGGVQKWNQIEKTLTSLSHNCVSNIQQQRAESLMRHAIAEYDHGVQAKTDFGTLKNSDVASSLVSTIPYIVGYALMLPSLLAEPIPFLKKNENKTIYFTKELQMKNRAGNQCNSQEIISFQRRCIKPSQNWFKSYAPLNLVKVEQNKKIEEAHSMLKVDFANKRVGGGVMNEGAVMEEILFAACPELIISRLFTESLEDNEVLVITGTEQFSEYVGYSRNFRFGGPASKQHVSLDQLGRIKNSFVALDALHFKAHEVEKQYQQNQIDRELHKAYVGFLTSNMEPISPIATGNWGCGAFNGDPELKFLIQWMAASQAQRPSIVYHTIGNVAQSHSIQSLTSFLQQKQMTVGKLYKLVVGYQKMRKRYPSIFDYIKAGKTG